MIYTRRFAGIRFSDNRNINSILFLITKLLKAITLGWLNSLLGLVFGIIKVGLILGILIMIFESLNSQFDLLKNGALDNAVVYNKIKDISQQIFPYFKSFISGLNV